MKSPFLGTGCPPPNPRRRGPATLLAHGEARCLVDAGSGVAVRLQQAGVPIVEVDRLFLTHLHSDHVNDPLSRPERSARWA